MFLYVLVAAIGTHMDLAAVAESPILFAIGGIWMLIHALFLILVAIIIKAPFFFVQTYFLTSIQFNSIHTINLELFYNPRPVLSPPISIPLFFSQPHRAASAPVVASAFHPSLAPVGVLLAVLGYAVGTGAAWLCAVLMQNVI